MAGCKECLLIRYDSNGKVGCFMQEQITTLKAMAAAVADIGFKAKEVPLEECDHQNEFTPFTPLPEGEVLRGAGVYNNEAGGLIETMVEVIAVCKDDTDGFKRQILANYLATYGALKIKIMPGEVEAIRRHYNF